MHSLINQKYLNGIAPEIAAHILISETRIDNLGIVNAGIIGLRIVSILIG